MKSYLATCLFIILSLDSQSQDAVSWLLQENFSAVPPTEYPLTSDQFKTLLKTRELEDLYIADASNAFTFRIKHRDDNQFELAFFVYKSIASRSTCVGIRYTYGYHVSTSFFQHSQGDVWSQHALGSEVSLSELLPGKVIIPNSMTARESLYKHYEFYPERIVISVNTWLFGKDLASVLNIDESDVDADYLRANEVHYLFKSTDFSFEKMQPSVSHREDLPLFNAKKEIESEDGPGVTNFACPQGVQVTASSFLPPQGANNYTAGNLLLEDLSKAWSEGVNTSGVGQWVEFTLSGDFLIGDSYLIVNGYAKCTTAWENNGRVKKFRVYRNGKPIALINLIDTHGYQTFNLNAAWLERTDFKKGDKIRFEIIEVYPGKKYADTLISYFVPTGNCG